MIDRDLITTADVMEALGGVNAVAELTRSGYKAVSNWKAFKSFPARTFLVMNQELQRRGLSAPASLWGMLGSERVAS